MSQHDESGTGIPTRAIHGAYLDVQRALRRYREAVDAGDENAIGDAHGHVQQAVLTLYDLLRPHLKHNDAVRGYWDGEAPSYPQNGHRPDIDDGKGVLGVQERADPMTVDEDTAEAINEAEDLKDVHDALDLNGDVCVTGIVPNGQTLVVQYDAYQLGLRQLDGWETEFRTTQTTIGGFLGAEEQTETERIRVDMPKLERAARELNDVAERLGALSEFEPETHTAEITDEDIQATEEYRQRVIEDR